MIRRYVLISQNNYSEEQILADGRKWSAISHRKPQDLRELTRWWTDRKSKYDFKERTDDIVPTKYGHITYEICDEGKRIERVVSDADSTG